MRHHIVVEVAVAYNDEETEDPSEWDWRNLLHLPTAFFVSARKAEGEVKGGLQARDDNGGG